MWWVNDVVDYLGTIVSSNKLLLGMPTYGYDWGDGLSTTTVTAARLRDLDNKYGLTRNFDDNSMSPYYTYLDDEKVYHQIWLENEISLTEKLNVALKKELAGVSFWRIGNGFTDLYYVLRAK